MAAQDDKGRPLEGVTSRYSDRALFRQLEGEDAQPKDERHEELRRQALASFRLLIELPNCLDKECFTSLQRNEDGDIRMSDIKYGGPTRVTVDGLKDDAPKIEALLHIHPLGQPDKGTSDILSPNDRAGTLSVKRWGADPDLRHYLLDASSGLVFEFQANDINNFTNRVEIGNLAAPILENATANGIEFNQERLLSTQHPLIDLPARSDIEVEKPQPAQAPKLDINNW